MEFVTTPISTKSTTKKSPIWKYFKEIGEKNFKCNICDKKIESRANVYNHLKLKHLQTFEEFQQQPFQKKNGLACPFCGKKIDMSNMPDHFKRKKCVYKQFYNNENNWSFAMDAMINKLPIQTKKEQLLSFLNEDYLVRSGDKIQNLLYVGISNSGTTLRIRFDAHTIKGKFKKYERLWKAIFLTNLSKKNAEILEALLILCCKLNTNMENKQLETRNIQQLYNEKEIFHERVMNYHRMIVVHLSDCWDNLEWEEFSTSKCTPKTSQIKEKKRCSDASKKEIKKWKKRAIDERKKINIFKEEKDENVLNASYSTWSDLNTTFTSMSSKSPTPSQPGPSTRIF